MTENFFDAEDQYTKGKPQERVPNKVYINVSLGRKDEVVSLCRELGYIPRTAEQDRNFGEMLRSVGSADILIVEEDMSHAYFQAGYAFSHLDKIVFGFKIGDDQAGFFSTDPYFSEYAHPVIDLSDLRAKLNAFSPQRGKTAEELSDRVHG